LREHKNNRRHDVRARLELNATTAAFTGRSPRLRWRKVAPI
jgi:hypothetical protein